MKPVTLEDIALRLNISRSTVSKALKGRSDVSNKTREKVLSLAKELNYVPNLTAVYLRTQHTKTIGVIIPSIINQFFSKVMIGIIEEAEKHPANWWAANPAANQAPCPTMPRLWWKPIT